MSMISAQIDELRRAAQTYRDLGNYESEQMLLDAADTIWQLRDDLQRTHGLLGKADYDESRAWDRVRKAEAENAKLRELVRIAGTYCANGLCGKDDGCPLYIGKPYCAFPDRMRELRVEVDG